MSPLDRPVWASLTSSQRKLSLGDDLARRYAPDINLFASARDDSDEALTALSGLIESDATIFILQVPQIRLPFGFDVLKEAQGVQMVYQQADLSTHGRDNIHRLGDADAPDMLELATLTEPGPFLPRTHLMGEFWGIRNNGRLAAMAGERMRFPGHTELSGVCAHPDFRGQGLARSLSAHIARRILDRREIPFLHAWTTNQAAIGLYESLGFRIRTQVNVAVLVKSGSRSRQGA